jgi:hypothetical protein
MLEIFYNLFNIDAFIGQLFEQLILDLSHKVHEAVGAKLEDKVVGVFGHNNAEQEDFLVLFLFEVLEVYSCLKVFDVDRNKFMTFFEKFYKLLILVSFALIKDYLLGEER